MNRAAIWPILVVVAVVGLVFYNIDGWLIEVDEGSALYASWRYAAGERPFIDFTTTHPPLFLEFGKLAIQLFGRDMLLLRSATAVSVIMGTTILALAIRSVWGGRYALAVWSCTLLSPQIYELTRTFRSDTLMLTLVFTGLAFMVWEIKYQRRVWLVAAGLVLGLTATTKTLAVMPLLGVAVWLFIRRIPDRDWAALLKDNLALGGAAAGIIIIGYAGLLLRTPESLSMMVGSHGESFYQISPPLRIVKGLAGWVFLFIANPLLIAAGPIAPLRFIRCKWSDPSMFWAAQFAGMFPIFLIIGPVYPRYLAYLVPSLLALLFIWLSEQKVALPAVGRPAILFYALVLPLLCAIPQSKLLWQAESDTMGLATWVAEHTEPDAVVVSDYAELSFHAGRRSIPRQVGIAHNWNLTGITTGAMLIAEMEAANAEMLLMHIPGGSRKPCHLNCLQDFDGFHAYLETYYESVIYWDRAGQLIEVWRRR